MNVFAEKRAEEFLQKNNFKIIEGIYIKKESEIKKALEKIGFPCAMKVSGEKIIHKNKIGGVKLNIQNYDKAVKAFNQLKRIKGCKEILIQRQIKGEEFLIGIKQTPEFGHAIAFGQGGINVESLKKVSFRICPISKEDAKEMIKEIVYLDKKKEKILIKILSKICALTKKHPNIKELDINPLIIYKQEAIILDAQIIFE